LLDMMTGGIIRHHILNLAKKKQRDWIDKNSIILL
jgi:hypothetical protein